MAGKLLAESFGILAIFVLNRKVTEQKPPQLIAGDRYPPFKKPAMNKILFLILIFGTTILSAQEVSCSDLMNYVEKEGYKKGNLNSLQLVSSDWLNSVTAYEIEDVIVVVAEIKKPGNLIYNTKKYIFCGIPSSNWNSFYYGLSDIGKSHGERFHKYIYNYQCNCY